jgi:D-alanine-D-alanine ligase
LGRLRRRVNLKEEFRGKRIAVLAGGESREREVSIRSGSKVFSSLKRQGYDVVMIDPDENLAFNLKKEKIDVVFIALHGRYGEDGCIQGLLETLKIPYTGSGVLASALAMNKIASKRIFERLNIPTSPYYVIDPEKTLYEQVKDILNKLKMPLIAKPVSEGSSIGVEIIKKVENIEPVLARILREFKNAFVEEYIDGQEVTVGILGSGPKLRALPVLELIPRKEFYDYEAKYTPGMTEFVIPAQLSPEVTEEVQNTALRAHKALGCHGVSRVDMIVDKMGKPWVCDVNSIPGLTDLSDLPAQAQAAGISYDELIEEILESSLTREKNFTENKNPCLIRV